MKNNSALEKEKISVDHPSIVKTQSLAPVTTIRKRSKKIDNDKRRIDIL